MTVRINPIGRSTLIVVLLTLLAACGGGSQSTPLSAGAPSAGPQTVAVQGAQNPEIMKVRADLPQPVAAFSLFPAEVKSAAENKN